MAIPQGSAPSYFGKSKSMNLAQYAKPFSAPFLKRIMGEEEVEVEVLQPEEKEEVTPPVILENMLERVTGTDERAKLPRQIEIVQETVVTHAPVLRRTYRNACVWHSGYATWRNYENYGSRLPLKHFSEPRVQLKELRYCINYFTWRFFGHWLTDSLTTALIDREVGNPWLPPNVSWGHAFEYMDVMGLPMIDSILVYADSLITYQDFSQGSSKRARYREIRNRIHTHIAAERADDYVYLQRGSTGAPRPVKNETEFINRLLRRNWKVIDLSQVSLDALVRSLSKARVVLSIEGSHISHAQVSMFPGTSLIVLAPHDGFTTVHLGYARANRLSFGMVIMEGSKEEGYHADLDEILKTIDITEQYASKTITHYD